MVPQLHRGDLILPAAAGRMRVRHLINTWRQRLNPVLLFIGYRWLAWLCAGVGLTLPGQDTTGLLKQVSILLLMLIVTLAITRQATNYLRLMQHRPVLLTLDIFLGWIVVALSGGGFLPFGPYALGSLIAPALLFGWRGALISGVGAGLLNLIPVSSTATTDPVGLNAGLPLMFALGWAALAAWRQPQFDLPSRQWMRLPGETMPATSTQRTSLPGNEHIGSAADWYPAAAAGSGVRRSAELAPAVSLRPDLRLAITQLVEGERQRGGLQVDCQIEGSLQRLTAAQQSVLLRTAQEALANVRRHAHASSCHIQLRVDERTALLQIDDDGVGLLDGTYERPHLHALRALRYRIAELDGQLAVFEGERGGLTVRVQLPLEP